MVREEEAWRRCMMLSPSHLFPTLHSYLFCLSSSSLPRANTSPAIPMKIVRAIHLIGFSSSHPSSSYLPSVGCPPPTIPILLDIHILPPRLHYLTVNFAQVNINRLLLMGFFKYLVPKSSENENDNNNENGTSASFLFASPSWSP